MSPTVCVPLPTGDPDSDQHGLFGKGVGVPLTILGVTGVTPVEYPVVVCVRETVLRTDTASALDLV